MKVPHTFLFNVLIIQLIPATFPILSLHFTSGRLCRYLTFLENLDYCRVLLFSLLGLLWQLSRFLATYWAYSHFKTILITFWLILESFVWFLNQIILFRSSLIMLSLHLATHCCVVITVSHVLLLFSSCFHSLG